MSDKMIQASEIGSYVYCNRAWWLKRVHGAKSANVREMVHGTQFHESHSKQLQRASLARRAAVALVVIAIILLIAWGLLG